MDIYEKINKIIKCGDLVEVGNQLVDFVDCVMHDKNRSNIVKQFYETVQRYAYTDYILLTIEEQQEVFADVLSIGLMHDSPYSKYDYFSYMREDDKKVFSLLVEKMLDSFIPA